MRDVLHDRGKALEDIFFLAKDNELLQKLRQQRIDQVTKEDIAAATGITDENLLQRLIEMEINLETLTALSVVPLIEVAWADGEIELNEREAVLQAADEAGIPKGGPGYCLLHDWLEQRPRPEMLAAWKHYVAALAKNSTKTATTRYETTCSTAPTASQPRQAGFWGWLRSPSWRKRSYNVWKTHSRTRPLGRCVRRCRTTVYTKVHGDPTDSGRPAVEIGLSILLLTAGFLAARADAAESRW